MASVDFGQSFNLDGVSGKGSEELDDAELLQFLNSCQTYTSIQKVWATPHRICQSNAFWH